MVIPIHKNYLISIFPRPVTNKSEQYLFYWPKLFKFLMGHPRELPEYTAEQKMKFGDYFVRGIISNGESFPERNDDNLSSCSLVILDIDHPLNNETPLPTPQEIHKALKNKKLAHVVHTSANPDRCRVILPTKSYKKENIGDLTWTAYCFLQELGIQFSYASESRVASQPWFLPQTSDITRHIALGCKGGKKFTSEMCSNILPKIIEEIPVSAVVPIEVGTAPTIAWVIDQIKNHDTLHMAVKRYAGWLKKTTDWSVGQIFNEITGIIEAAGIPKFIERWPEEREKLERWFNNQDFVGSTETAEDLENMEEEFMVLDEFIETLGEEEWAYKDLVLAQQVTVIIAKPSGGKTSFMLNIAAPKMVENGYKVFYVDSDAPPSDYKMMKALANKGKFFLLIPNTRNNQSTKTYLEKLEKKIAQGIRMDKCVYIFDTLKKFADMMSKKDLKAFLSNMKQMTVLGATVVLLGHANKHLSKDNLLLYEGVGDVQSDSDNLIYFAHLHNNETRTTKVSTVVDGNYGAKVRGIFEQFTFEVSKSTRAVKMLPDTDAVVYPMVELTTTQAVRAVINDGVLAVKAIEFLEENIGKEISFDTFANGITSKINVGTDRVKSFIRRNARDDDNDVEVGLGVFKFNKIKTTKFYTLTDKSKVFVPGETFDA